MLRPVVAALGSLVLLAGLLEAQDSKTASEKSRTQSASDANTAIRLALQSHDLDQLLRLPVRLEMLGRQAELVCQLDADLGRAWADELFTLSLEAKGNQKLRGQSQALRILIRLNPDRALERLHELSMDDPEATSAASPAVTGLAHQVFGILAERDGETALPVLQQEAERLGRQGYYPYAALGYTVMQTTNKYWGSDNERAIRILEPVLDAAFARYMRGPRTYRDDCEFGRMLEVLAGGLPFASVQPALRALAKNLLATNVNEYHFRAALHTANGEMVTMDNAIDAAILHLGSLFNRDSELTHELEASRPELQKALESLKEGQHGSISFGPAGTPQNRQTARNYQAYMDAVGLSYTNPAEAISRAEALPDEQRTRALLQIARGTASSNPERAAALINEIQQESKPMDEETSLDFLSARASVAAAQNNDRALHELLEQGFAVANRVIQEQQRTGEIRLVMLTPLVYIGTRNDPDLTIPFVESLPPSQLKADVLLAAASALVAKTHMTPASTPQQAAQKPNP
jgi:hypothetical protein